jgi:Secretion system C-terminal sorting domain
VASKISNEDGTCNLFTACNFLREENGSEYDSNVDKGLKISPNPASERLHIELPKSAGDHRQYAIFNQIGKVVMTEEILPGETQLDLFINKFTPGLYLVNLIEYGEITHSEQLVILR